MCHLEYKMAYWISVFFTNFPGKGNNYFSRLTGSNDIICPQEIHGKDEFLQAFQVLAPRFQLCGSFIPNNANAGAPAICNHKNLLLDDAFLTHVVTCQCRDHIVAEQSTKASLTNSWRQRRNLLLALMEFRGSFYRCAGGLGSQFHFNAYKHVLEGGTIPALFAESRTVFVPQSSDVDINGRIVRSLEALRPLTLCNCDCKILTTAICRGLHWYTMKC